MYCPKCATPLSDEQKFCRSCGLDLQLISRILNGDYQGVKQEIVSKTAKRSQNRKKRLQTLGVFVVLLSLLIGCLIPVFIGIGIPNLNSLILILAGIAGLLLFLGSMVTIYADLPAPELTVNDLPTELPRKNDHNQLPAADYTAFVSSVTERTTDLLATDQVKVVRKDS